MLYTGREAVGVLAITLMAFVADGVCFVGWYDCVGGGAGWGW